MALALLSACAGTNNSGNPPEDSGEANVAAEEVARVWVNLDSGKQRSACAAYRLSELFSDNGDGDAAGVGFVWSGGSLSSLNRQDVEEAWRVLLEDTCPDTDEIAASSSETCVVETNKNAEWSANCSVVPGTGDVDDTWYETGEYTFNTTLIELCIPSRYQTIGIQTRTGNSEIPWRTRAPFNPRTAETEMVCPSADTGDSFRVWKFNVPEDSARAGDEFRIVTGKNLKKPLMRIQVSFVASTEDENEVVSGSPLEQVNVWIEYWDPTTMTDLGDGTCNVRLGTRELIGGETFYLQDDRNLTLSGSAIAEVSFRESVGGIPSEVQALGGVDGRPCVFSARFESVETSDTYSLLLGEQRFTWTVDQIRANGGWAATWGETDLGD